MVSGVAGFRGGVSLAIALAVPATTSSGDPFPGRDLIVFVTAGGVGGGRGAGRPLPAVGWWGRRGGAAAAGPPAAEGGARGPAAAGHLGRRGTPAGRHAGGGGGAGRPAGG